MKNVPKFLKNIKNFAEEFNLEENKILRINETYDNNNYKITVALESNLNIKENYQKFLSNKILSNEREKIEIKFFNSKYLMEKIKRNYNNNNNNEFNNLRADNFHSNNKNYSKNNSRHGSINENNNLSWRKGSNANNNNNIDNGRKGSFVKEK